MRQRVMIALALACGPRLLFADEPTTALDVTVQAEILNLLQDQQTDRFMAMVLVTHDLGVVAGRTDEIAVMYAGKVVEQAPTAVLFSKMRHPYTEALLRSIPKIDDPQPHPVAGDHRSPARPAPPAARVPVRAALPVRRRRLPRRDATARVRRGRGPPLRLLPPARLAGERRGAGAQPRRRACRRPSRCWTRRTATRSISARCSRPRRRTVPGTSRPTSSTPRLTRRCGAAQSAPTDPDHDVLTRHVPAPEERDVGGQHR